MDKRNSLTDGPTGNNDPALKKSFEKGLYEQLQENDPKRVEYSKKAARHILGIDPAIQLLDNSKAETYDAVTEVVRRADAKHELTGGGSRHYVRDILLPLLEEAGIRLCRVNQKQKQDGVLPKA
jgi:hypothetical protein